MLAEFKSSTGTYVIEAGRFGVKHTPRTKVKANAAYASASSGLWMRGRGRVKASVQASAVACERFFWIVEGPLNPH